MCETMRAPFLCSTHSFTTAWVQIAMVKSLVIRLLDWLMPQTINNYHRMVRYFLWLEDGRQAPAPPIVKHIILKEYGVRYQTPVFIETGTYLAKTLLALRHLFDELHSIELDSERHQRAKGLLKSSPHVHLHQGDSGTLLPELLNKLDRRALFWLDAHFPPGESLGDYGETPIVAELKAIAAHPIKDHVILIDDARDFGQGEYPSLVWMRDLTAELFPGFVFSVVDDVIRIHAPFPWEQPVE